MKNKTQPWPHLIQFDYDYYCQGMEEATTTVLVYAFSFEQACNYIKLDSRFGAPRNFENLTIGVVPKFELSK